MRAEFLKFSIFSVTIYQVAALGGLFYYAENLFSLIHTELHFHQSDPLSVTQTYLDAYTATHPDNTLELNDLTDKGMMYAVLFQTFCYLQLFNLFNARRPSFKDLNPLHGISILTAVCLALLLIFQFSIVYVPRIFGYGSLNEWSNLLCMAIGGGSCLWFAFCKSILRFAVGVENTGGYK